MHTTVQRDYEKCVHMHGALYGIVQPVATYITHPFSFMTL